MVLRITCLSLETAPNGEIHVCSGVGAGNIVTSHPLDANMWMLEKHAEQVLHTVVANNEEQVLVKLHLIPIVADKAILVAPDLPAKTLVAAAHAPEYFPPQPFPITRDELCPDKDYLPPTHDQYLHHQHLLDHNIPQVDGHDDTAEQHQQEDEQEWIYPHPNTGLWVCMCCTYMHIVYQQKTT